MRYELGVGVGFTRDGKTVKNVPEKVSAILETASRWFGGVAVINVNGGWVNGKGECVTEPGIVIRIDNSRDPNRIYEFAAYVKALLNQESVILTVQAASTEFL